MKIKAGLVLFTLILTGCNSSYMATAPGAPLPSGLAVCQEWDEIGRCRQWTSESETCINPEGVNAKPPIVPCSSIRK